MRDGHIPNLLIGLLILGSLWMLWPFLGALLFGILTAYLLIYLEKAIYHHLENRILSNLIVILLLTVLLSGLLYGISSSVSEIGRNIESFLTALSGSASFIIKVFNLPESLASITASITSEISSIMRSSLVGELRQFPSVAINLLLYATTAVYFYQHGQSFRTELYEIIASREGAKGTAATRLLRSLDDLFRNVFLSNTLIALTMTVLAGIGYFLMSIDFWWGWALLIGIFAFLPLIRAAFVYLALGGLYMVLGSFWLGVVIIIYSIIVINTLPLVFISPYIDSETSDENSALLFIGFIAGPVVLGLKGIILGPTILVLTRDYLLDIFAVTEEPS
ncbi:MAG: AI-2E family transporter [Candidatus Nanohaloarchaea archaeon]|nr:AI-2E family transporter [Candidatus Nanohaloarchaea archaeon]